jgi:hypothetical protein
MIVLPKTPHKKLTAEQQKAFETMRSLLQNLTEADRRYDALMNSQSGRIISTDIARYLDARYAKEPKKDQERDLEPGWDLAWRYAQNRLVREIKTRGNRKRLRFMSGGWGAGKTFALRNEPSVTPCLIWDGTMGDLTWAVEMIDLALTHQWQVEVAYVYRDLELALYGAVQRKREVGRGVPLKELPNNHHTVQQTILSLTDLYRGDPSVSFLYLHNLGVTGIEAGTPEIGLIDLEKNGALHYLPRHEHYYAQAAENLDSGVSR